VKKCCACSETKELDCFYTDNSTPDKKVYSCIPCYEKRRLERKKQNPEKHLKNTQSFWLKHRYNITLDEYTEMLENQEGKCAICGRPDSGKKANKAFCVDHCHETGKVRGLLCMPCNRSLGQFQDNADILRKAADYIDSHKEKK
jgi:hypothetical protein